jgi:predicted phage-related endonuclease
MADFSPEVRNSGWWSSDSRLAAQGRANEAILIKQGKMERPDLSNIEAVQMGHVMEPVIGQLAQQKLGVELTKIEDAYTHKKEPWLKSHFDFAGRDKNGQGFLVEAKNYNAATRNKFDVEAGLMPVADLSQLVHEATVFGVDKVYLAVLFGGQEFVLIPKTITEEMKEAHVQEMAKLWAHVQAGTALPPETSDQARALYPVSQEGLKTASQGVEQAAAILSDIKAKIKALEAQEDQLATMLQGYLADSDTLVTVDGRVLATWKSAKPSMKFDSKLFQTAMPDIYRQFTVSSPGSRRFLLKG